VGELAQPGKGPRMTTVLNYGLIALLFVAWIGLFTVKDAARETAARVGALEHQFAQEEERVEALMTDWAILNEPGYLQDLAQMHLGLEATSSNQIVTMSALPPVPLTDTQDPATGTFLASARNYQQIPSARAPRVDPYVDWARPALRPQGER